MQKSQPSYFITTANGTIERSPKLSEKGRLSVFEKVDTSRPVNMTEILAQTGSVADYTVIDCRDSLVVINAMTGLSPQETQQRTQSKGPALHAQQYILQPRL